MTLQKTHPKVGIIGGTNGTGEQFAKFFKKQNFQVEVSGRNTKITNTELAKTSDILIFAPPLKTSIKIMEETIFHCKNKNQIILDVCSIKTPHIKILKKAKGKIAGLHPLFGPQFKTPKNQNIIICPGNKKIIPSLVKLFKAMEMKTTIMNAKKHDELMSLIQVIPHLSAIITGSLLRIMKININESLKTCSPIYKTELYMIARIFAQNPSLYSEIISKNSNSPKITKNLKLIINKLNSAIIEKDNNSIEKMFKLNKKFFNNFSKIALKKTQKMIEE